MTLNYSVKELAEILNCSIPVARKKAEVNNLKSTSKKVHGRNVNAYYISADKLSQLIKEVEENKKIYSRDVEEDQDLKQEMINSESDIEVSWVESPAENSTSNAVVAIMREFSQQLKSAYEMHQDKIESANRKILLLEDSESRTQHEYAELQSKINDMENTIEVLQKENKELQWQNKILKNKKWWQIKVF